MLRVYVRALAPSMVRCYIPTERRMPLAETASVQSRAFTVARVFDAALAYFEGDREHALDWLKHPNPALGGETPLQRAATVPGAEDVIDLIGRLEHGIPT